jgi:hypothetical protein
MLRRILYLINCAEATFIAKQAFYRISSINEQFAPTVLAKLGFI